MADWNGSSNYIYTFLGYIPSASVELQAFVIHKHDATSLCALVIETAVMLRTCAIKADTMNNTLRGGKSHLAPSHRT